MSRATVHVEEHFKAYGDELAGGIRTGLKRSALALRADAPRQPTAYHIKKIMSNTSQSGVYRTGRGWEIKVYWDDFRALFFERGTYARKGATKSARVRANRRSAGLQSGVKPVRYIRKSLNHVFPRMVDYIDREIKR